MKKLIYSLMVFCLMTFAFNSSAQTIEKGDLQINLGTGIVDLNDAVFNDGLSVGIPLSLSGDYGLISNLSVGGFLSFMRRNADNADWHITYVAFGGKVSYHATPIINNLFNASIDEDKIDFYATAYVGLETTKWSTSFAGIDNSDTDLIIRPLVGARYFLTDKIGFYAELGYGPLDRLLNFGASFKF